jgi:hypothetical protein
MNLDTVLKCAQMAATKQEAFLGHVDQDILDLIAELTPAAEPVVAVPVEAAAEEAPAEEAAAEEEAPAAE